MKYTHILINGNAWIPERFYERTLLTSEEAFNLSKQAFDGFIREIEPNEPYLSKEQMEALNDCID